MLYERFLLKLIIWTKRHLLSVELFLHQRFVHVIMYCLVEVQHYLVFIILCSLKLKIAIQFERNYMFSSHSKLKRLHIFSNLLGFHRSSMIFIIHLWHDRWKWVACRRFSILCFLTPFYGNLKMLHFDVNPRKNWRSGYRVESNSRVLKTLSKKIIWLLSRPISLKRYLRHPTQSPWSCPI